ncbi:PEGA domain-containing protein [Sorangium sp. So ce204]|uniref:PEGA domain-containing protein n=1 Tax=Sorangium sp. So ce204 TaxID=3133288 RepID=UPI003F613672
MIEEARKLYDDGVRAVSESRWEAAHALFLAARALHPHYTIVGNLGDCELKLGRYREAAENLALYVRELKKDTTSTAEERARAEAAYAKARAKVGTLVVRTDVDGARVFVDGTFRGVTPLPDPLFVEPGAHTISVEHEDYETKKTTVQLGAGGAIEHSMPMERKPAGTPPAKPLDTTMAPPAGGAEEHAGGPRRAVITGGAVAAGVAAGVGTVLAVVAASKWSAASDQRDRLTSTGGIYACAAGQRTANCRDAVERYDDASALWNAAIWTWIGAGTVGLGTAAYAWLATEPAQRTGHVTVSPMFAAHGGGFVVTSAW